MRGCVATVRCEGFKACHHLLFAAAMILSPLYASCAADIFWVFGTPVMVHVAKNFDAPIKLLFPRADALAGECCLAESRLVAVLPLELCASYRGPANHL
jgi:hypothetical protein